MVLHMQDNDRSLSQGLINSLVMLSSIIIMAVKNVILLLLNLHCFDFYQAKWS